MNIASRFMLTAWILVLSITQSTVSFSAEIPGPENSRYNPLEHLWLGVQDLPSERNAWVLLAGSAAALAASSADASVQRYFSGGNRLTGFETIGNVWGSPFTAIAIGGGLYAFGDQSEGKAVLEALLTNSVITGGLKVAVGRTRPDNSNDHSFPSGHSSISMTTASVLMELYGPAIGIPAFALGGYTMLSRMASNVHYLSDTLAGATLGLCVGYAYAQHHLDREKKESKVTVLPYFESRESWGLVANLKL